MGALKARHLATRAGEIRFPQYIPVTTYGKKYPLDELVRPFLPRLAGAVMVSHHYARQANSHPGVPLLVDSGGFASLFGWAKVEQEGDLGVIRIGESEGTGGEQITPSSVLEFQEKAADVAFTLDFPIPDHLAETEGPLRQKLTIHNALWALRNRRRRDLPLYACVQGWDRESFVRCARAYVGAGFEGIAIGGLVPRARDHALITDVVREIRALFPEQPLHAFGIGQPPLVRELFTLGLDSVDSSAYVKMAADGRSLGSSQLLTSGDLSPLQRMHLAIANLAMASQRALPLGFAPIVYGTMQTSRRAET